MKTKKILVLLLVLSITVSAVSGCGKLKSDDVNSDVGDINLTGTPLVTKQAELSVWIPLHTNHAGAGITSISQIASAQALDETTNVKINWASAPAADSETAFNLLLASNDLPDIIVKDNDAKVQLKQGGIIAPLGALIDKYAPNIKSLYASNSDVETYSRDDDGDIWGIRSYVPEGRMSQIWTIPLIRQDWLDKLGLDMPATQDEWYSVLKAFKENDMNGNGDKDDEIPLVMYGFWPVAYLGFFPLGINQGNHDNGFYLENGKVQFSFFNEKYMDGVKYVKKLYEEGLIDREFLVQDLRQLDSKIQNNRAGAVIGGAYRYVNEYSKLLKDTIPDYNMAVAGLLQSEDGQRYSFAVDEGPFSSLVMYITNSSKNPELAMRWIDFLFSQEGGDIAHYGKLGETYDIVDGYPEFRKELLTDPDTGNINADLRAKYTFGGDGSWGLEFPHFTRKMELVNGKWKPNDSMLVFGTEEIFASAYNAVQQVNLSKKLPMYKIIFTDSEKEELAQVMTDAAKYVEEATAQMITGAKSLDSYASDVEMLKTIGVERAIDIYQSAYDRANTK